MAEDIARTVYFVSESTGITAEAYGHTLLSQFVDAKFVIRYMPYISSLAKAQSLSDELAHIAEAEGRQPIVFATMVDEQINNLLRHSECHYFELFDRFMPDLIDAIGLTPTPQSGVSHGLKGQKDYSKRIDIINYALTNDDGISLKKLDQADVILIGVSRSGKTPTCLYLALHFGLRAANYPITEEDFEKGDLPPEVLKHRHKMFGLTIDPQNLADIRQRRRPDSPYAELKRCRSEVQMAEDMFYRYQLTVLDSTSHSIEELASYIVKSL